jgi:hypothetical protein
MQIDARRTLPTSGPRRLAAILLLLIWAGGYTWALWRYYTSIVPGGNDFLARYAAWEAYLKHGLNPYSEEAAVFTQLKFYGRPALSGEDEVRLTYPFYSILVHGPFVYLDYPVALALHMVLLQAALFAGVAFTLAALRWSPPLWLTAGLMAWALLNYPEARGVILGQVAILGYFALAGSLWLLSRGRDAAAGALLVLATVKPTLIFLVVPFLLLWDVARGRWRFLIGFGVTLLILCAGSWLLLPSWLGDFLYRVRTYSSYTVGESPVWLLTHQALPGLGSTGEYVLTGLLLLVMLWAWWRVVRPSADSAAAFYWTLGLTLVVSNLIVPRSATTNYVLLLVPTLWIFAILDRHGVRGRWIMMLVMAVAVVGQWWLHFATVVGNQEQAVMYLPWPLALGAGLWLGRGWLLRETRAAGWWPMPVPA